MISTILAKLWLAVALLADADHCSRWTPTAWGPRCSSINLRARCLHAGWHVVYQGIPVCSHGCPDEAPTT